MWNIAPVFTDQNKIPLLVLPRFVVDSMRSSPKFTALSIALWHPMICDERYASKQEQWLELITRANENGAESVFICFHCSRSWLACFHLHLFIYWFECRHFNQRLTHVVLNCGINIHSHLKSASLRNPELDLSPWQQAPVVFDLVTIASAAFKVCTLVSYKFVEILLPHLLDRHDVTHNPLLHSIGN